MKSSTIIIIPVYNSSTRIKELVNKLSNYKNTDILLVDDGSTENLLDMFEDNSSIKYIKHETCLGYGASIITGYKYARDFNYDKFITVDPAGTDYSVDISEMIENINYGYDIVTCSRILENYNHSKIPERYIKITGTISSVLNNETEFDLTDPLSGIKAYKTSSLDKMELTDFSHGILLQIIIQSCYFGLDIFELPSRSETAFGYELDQYDDCLNYFLSIINTEKYLYKKGTIN